MGFLGSLRSEVVTVPVVTVMHLSGLKGLVIVFILGNLYTR